MLLDNNSSKPLYVQIIELIKKDIKSQKYEKGTRLPSEIELGEIYDVSRITIRKAITELEKEGVLNKQHGKGTFVSEVKVKRELMALNGFSDFLMSLGNKVDNHIISNEVVPADELIAEKLQVKDHSKILKLQRLQLMNNDPIHLETGFYPLDRFPDLAEYAIDYSSIYKLLRERYNVKPSYDNKLIKFEMATKEKSSFLKCAVGSPLYFIEKTDYDERGIPIHNSYSFLPTSKVVFEASTKPNSNRSL